MPRKRLVTVLGNRYKRDTVCVFSFTPCPLFLMPVPVTNKPVKDPVSYKGALVHRVLILVVQLLKHFVRAQKILKIAEVICILPVAGDPLFEEIETISVIIIKGVEYRLRRYINISG